MVFDLFRPSRILSRRLPAATPKSGDCYERDSLGLQLLESVPDTIRSIRLYDSLARWEILNETTKLHFRTKRWNRQADRLLFGQLPRTSEIESVRRWGILDLHFPTTSARKLLRSRSWLAAHTQRLNQSAISLMLKLSIKEV